MLPGRSSVRSPGPDTLTAIGVQALFNKIETNSPLRQSRYAKRRESVGSRINAIATDIDIENGSVNALAVFLDKSESGRLCRAISPRAAPSYHPPGASMRYGYAALMDAAWRTRCPFDDISDVLCGRARDFCRHPAAQPGSPSCSARDARYDYRLACRFSCPAVLMRAS
jgi:hypothetical protein